MKLFLAIKKQILILLKLKSKKYLKALKNKERVRKYQKVLQLRLKLF